MEVAKWYFTREELEKTPSRKCGITAEKELSYRQQSAKLIQDMGQRLQVNQLAINTAIVYMHRFYMYHTFSRFHRHAIAPASLFLAAKVEEQPRKLEHVIKVASCFINHSHHALDTQSDTYIEKAQELVMNENILLQTLGFDVAIDHPHTYVVKCFQMVRALTNLPQTSYFMATNSLHMTTMCLQYKPTVVACVCIDIVCKWSNYEIQRYTEGKDWFVLVDPTVTADLLEKLSAEFIAVLDKFPNRLKKFRSMNSVQHGVPSSIDYNRPQRHSNSLTIGPRSASSTSIRSHDPSIKEAGSTKPSHLSSSQKTVLTPKEYNEKREKERRERERHASQNSSSHPVSSSSSHRTHQPRQAWDFIDQLRMPPPQVVPLGRTQTSHNRDSYPRKEHIPNDKHEKLVENHGSAKQQDKISDIYDSSKCLDTSSDNRDSVKSHNDKISEHYEKVIERTKHTPIIPKIEKVETKPLRQETNYSKPTTLPGDTNIPVREVQHSSRSAPALAVSAPPAVIKKESQSPSVAQNSIIKSINSNMPISLYHPRLDGKHKPAKEVSLSQVSGGERTTSLPKPEKYSSKDDVTSISSISKLLSQSITKAPKEVSDVGPATISSTSHMPNKKHRTEHSHKPHDKDKKKKKSKHKTKDKKERHRERESSKEHKKNKKQKKHKEKDKESKHVKSIFDDEEDDSTSNTPIKLTIIRDKGVYTPENSQISAPITTPTTNNSVSTHSAAGTGGLKITIPKSRLQTNTPQHSPPRGIPPRNNNTPNVKLKIPKEKLKYEKESRKRERSPSEGQPPNKYLRTSGGVNIQKVLDTARWSSKSP